MIAKVSMPISLVFLVALFALQKVMINFENSRCDVGCYPSTIYSVAKMKRGRTATELLYNLCLMIQCGEQLVSGKCGPRTTRPGPRTTGGGGGGGGRPVL